MVGGRKGHLRSCHQNLMEHFVSLLFVFPDFYFSSWLCPHWSAFHYRNTSISTSYFVSVCVCAYLCACIRVCVSCSLGDLWLSASLALAAWIAELQLLIGSYPSPSLRVINDAVWLEDTALMGIVGRDNLLYFRAVVFKTIIVSKRGAT